jgi:dihydrofolate reductase
MLIYSMSVSVDGFIADRDGAFEWAAPSDDLFLFPPRAGGRARRVSTRPQALRGDARVGDGSVAARQRSGSAFADVWCALPKVVFSRTLDRVQGNARLAEGSVAEEVTAALDATDKDVSIGGAGLAAAAIELGSSTSCACSAIPFVVGGGTPFLPPVTEDVPLDLVETRTFGSRVIYERYRRAHDQAGLVHR